MRNEIDYRVSLKNKGFIHNADGSYSKPDSVLAPRPQIAEPEPALRHESLGAAKVPRRPQARFVLRFTQFTRRPQDPDNCCPKYHIDWMRSEGFIPDDTIEDIELTIKQTRVEKEEDEGVLIDLFPLCAETKQTL